MRTPTLAPVILALLAVAGSAFAQQPGGGELLREFRQLAPAIPDPLPTLSIPPAPLPLPPVAVGQEPVKVATFHFVGDLAEVEPRELEQLVQQYVGRELAPAALQEVAERAARHLRAKGYSVAHAVVPAQDLHDGTVQVTVLMGRIDGDATGNGIVVDAQGARISEERVRKTLANATMAESLYLKLAGMERGLLLLNELPGVRAAVQLDPGIEPGTTRITVDVDEGPLWVAAAAFDNFGNRYAGAERAHALLHMNNATGQGDQARLHASVAQGVRANQLGYSLPLGYNGARAGIDYVRLDYELGKELRGRGASGQAHALTLGVRYPFVRSARSGVTGSIGYESKVVRDELQGTLQSNRRIDHWALGLEGHDEDGLGRGGVTRYAFGVQFGAADLARVPAALAGDAAGARTQGSYNKATYTLQRTQRLQGNWSLFGALSGQISDRNLDPAEKFVLGGMAGVRAYPAGEAPGDSGWLTALELRYDVPAAGEWGEWQLLAFVDAGAVQLHRDPWAGWDAGALGQENHYILGGTGLGVSLVRPGSHAIRAVWARKVGSNPRRAASGADADGRQDNSRFWLQALLQF